MTVFLHQPQWKSDLISVVLFRLISENLAQILTMDKQESNISGVKFTRSVARGGSGCDTPIIPYALRMIRLSEKRRGINEAVMGDKDECSGCETKNAVKDKRSVETSYNCYHCTDRFSTKSELIKHIETHFGASNVDVSAKSSDVLDIKGANSKRQGLRQKGSGHLKEIPEGTLGKGKGRKGRKFAEGADPCVESVSSNSLPCERDIRKGKCSRARERPYSCSVCNRCFTHSSALKNHMRIHTGEKPYSCSVCNKSFSQRGNLNTHMLTHTGDRPYLCTICCKSFSQSSYLTVHLRIHTADKPYSCSICRKSFTQSSNLNMHIRTHTGERPFSCTICCKSFSSSYNLSRHTRIHTADRPYSCNVCSKSFSRKYTLDRHFRIHRREKSYSCSECGKSFSQKSHLVSHFRTHM